MNGDSKLKAMIKDADLNKNIGNFSYWLHRVTGIGLSIYLIIHIYVLSSAISGPESFNERMGSVQNPFFAVLEVLLIAGVFAHMLNGLRITITDFFSWSRGHKVLFWILAVIFVILMIVAIKLQWPKFFIDNYAMGGH
ncbi:MAG: succinate dehydrogenase, cytochrome b556 subunit [Candidatus Zixiibacteriota bacterium]|nr:MAG: succinate dehydrogenase, cytochrome b556 subunit [candidate division Zixibacteria bacterium]